MKFVKKDAEHVFLFQFPESSGADTVSYVILKGSDGSTVESGTAVFLADDHWKVSFTPTDDDVYSIEITHAENDDVQSEVFATQTVAYPTIDLASSFDAVLHIPESQSGDTVTCVVYSEDGSTFASGAMTNIGGASWKFAFTPTVAGFYCVVATITHGDSEAVKYLDVLKAAAAASTEISEPTAQEMLTELNKAIQRRLTGGAVLSYSIGGRNLQYMNLTEMYNIRDRLKREVNAASGPARNYYQQKRAC